ncbi:recombinase [Cupriavidus sp. IK-TO18]|uniref:recombinase n=1 Tax=Cupriavidus sp. IK-TO18 TaxID=2782182 RepID=UPI001897408B|nr:recombinase [Cupriavidus sp. IK-TO18]MBF6987238.1 recombinase [Cupriavidus sp. IK-TO18]
MAEVYREFTLRGRSDWQEVVAMVKAAAPTMASDGRPLRVILVNDGADRTEEQVKFYWKAVIEPIAEQVVVAGCRFTKATWHKAMKEMFLPPKELRLQDGRIVLVEPSVARGEITVGAMAEYIRQVEAHAASTYGVVFD